MTALPSSSYGGGDIWANGGVTLPQYSSTSSKSTFAERARRRKADLQAQGMISPPPGLGLPATRARSQTRDPSPSFYNHDGRAQKKPLLPIHPSIAPAGSVLSPTSPSPIPRTPSPPVHPPSKLSLEYHHHNHHHNYHQQSQQKSAIPLPRTTGNPHVQYPHSAPAASVAPSTTSSAASKKSKRNVIRKKSSSHQNAATSSNGARTGSTTSANASNASVTTSTSTSYVGRENYPQPSILGSVPVPSTSYTTSVTPTPPSSYKPPRTEMNGSAKKSGPPGIPAPQQYGRSNRSVSGGQQASASGANRLSIPAVSQQLSNKSVPRLSTTNLPAPITVPVPFSENTSTSSPSTAYCGSPGMFSYASTPTSSSTNPSSLQSPGFPPYATSARPGLVRNVSSTGPDTGPNVSDSTTGKTRNRDAIPLREDRPPVSHGPSRLHARMSTTSTSSTSTVRPESRRSASLGSTAQIGVPKPAIQGPQHTRKLSKESNSSKSAAPASNSFGFHIRKSSRDSSKIGTGSASHSRKSSRDSTTTTSVNTSSSNLLSNTAPIPIPSKGKAPPRPSREGAPDLGSEGLGLDTNVVIQSGIVAHKDSRSKTPKMTIPASSSLPYRRNAPTTPGTTPPTASFLSTSIPNRSKTLRMPAPTTSKGTKVVHGFSTGTTNNGGASASSSNVADTSLSPRKKKDEKKASSESIGSATSSSLTRPSLFGSRGRTKTVPSPADKTLPTVTKRPGPAAGTGHEGYSQFSKGPRTRSLSGSALPAPAPKSHSTNTTPSGSLNKTTGLKLLAAGKGADADGFFSGRLEPVVIQGGGAIRQNHNDENSKKDSRATSPYGTGNSVTSIDKGKKKSVESQKTSLDISRPLPVTRGSASLDLPRSARSSSERPQIPNGIPRIQAPISTEADFKSQGSVSKAPRTSAQMFETYPDEEDYWPNEKEPSWLKGAKKLAPPPVTNAPTHSTKWWDVFRKSPSAPEVGNKDKQTHKKQGSISAKHSPQLSQDAKFGDNRPVAPKKEIQTPPLKDQQPAAVTPPTPATPSTTTTTTSTAARRESKGYADALRKQNHFHDLLLPDPPSLPKPSRPAMQSPPMSTSGIPKSKPTIPQIPQPSQTRSGNIKSGLRPPQVQSPPSAQGRLVQANAAKQGFPLPVANIASKAQPTHFVVPDSQNSAALKTIRAPPGLPIPSAMKASPATAVPNFSEIREPSTSSIPEPSHCQCDHSGLAPQEESFRFVPNDLDFEFPPETEEIEEPQSRSSSSAEIRPPVSGPTPSPRTTPRLKAIGRIPTPGASQKSAPAFELPTLAQILPPPPQLPSARQSPKIEPPKRMAHPQYIPDTAGEDDHYEDSVDEDDYEDGFYDEDEDPELYAAEDQEEVDITAARRAPFADLPPLVITEDMNKSGNRKRASDSADDWNEYDDYLDEMTGTPKADKSHSRSQTSSLGSPFPYSYITSKFNAAVEKERKGKGKESSKLVNDSPTLPSQAVFGTPTVVQFPPSNKKKLTLDKSKLSAVRPLAARPTFSPAIHPNPNPNSLFSPGLDANSLRSSSCYSVATPGTPGTPRMVPFADFIAAYGTESGATKVMSVVDPLHEKPKASHSQHNGLLSPQSALLSPMSSATDFEDDSQSDNDSARQSIISVISGTEDAIEGEMKVRLWALMTSRWLSGGRVLLSPAHEELRVGGPSSRILVIDGLGNDDWSFYCSLNYLNAAVYNLTLSPTLSPMSPANEQPPSGNPTNHHQIHYTSFAQPFPFPSGFFSAVSFRFLPASIDALWPFIISQCIRVLRPGGYMELSVMDLDMANMGPRTARTVDTIKDALHKRQTGNSSDWFRRSPTHKALKLMATRGFVDITRCRVGIPTVGNVDGSREEQASMQQILREGASEETDMNSAEGINRVVSKVGRWWYNKCFEDYPHNDQDDEERESRIVKSLWEDHTLLRECEKRKTSFRMLISYAKKPMDWKEF